MAEVEQEKDRKRSPNYPSISLQAAVGKIGTLWDKDKGASSTAEVIAGHWLTTVKSSSFLQAIASLKKYALIAEVDGQAQKLKLTTAALDIVMLPPSDPRHLAALQQVALAPKLFKKLWDEYGINLPSDANLKHELVTAMHFMPDTAVDAIKQYRRNIEFAKLGNRDKINEEAIAAEPDIGDFVQWESQGVAQFKEPRKVTGKSEDGQYLFVDGEKSGLPIDQVRRIEDATGKDKMALQTTNSAEAIIAGATKIAPPNPTYKPQCATVGAKQDTYMADAGDVIVRWPAVLTREEYEEVSNWLDMLKKKIKRSVVGGLENSAPG